MEEAERITLYKEAVLGDTADEFFNSDLGKYVLERSEAETLEAIAELKTVSPHNSVRISELQEAIQVAEKCIRWLCEAIYDGRKALYQLEMEHEEGHS